MKKILVIVIAVAICIGTVALVCTNYGYLYTRLYMGDRISVTYSITEDEKDVVLSAVDWKYETEESVSVPLDSKSFSIKGGEYGAYAFSFVPAGELDDTSIAFVYINTNDWHITSIDIDADLVEENGVRYVEYTVSYEESNDTTPYTTFKSESSGKTELTAHTRIQFGV